MTQGGSRLARRTRGGWTTATVAAALTIALAASAAAITPYPAYPAYQAYPSDTWSSIPDADLSSACRADLAKATALTTALPTTGAMAIKGGHVLWQYGDLEKLSYLASVRKSLLAMLYGKYVEQGRIRLDATLADLGIDDVGGLLPTEKQATVADLLAARSGVYHEAANAACTGCGSTAGDPPGPRGTVPHGTYFLYNNWDFNALGTIFEQQTGQDIYEAFAADIAAPIGLQDFRLDAQRKSRRPQASMHPAYHFYLSTRDMARVGYLMLRGGRWAGRQVVPAEWVKKMVTPVTHVADMHPDDLKKGPFGYGYLWWIWDGPFADAAYRGAYTGIGAIGQFITVLPERDLVIAHKTEPSRGGAAVTRPQYLELVDALASARCN